MGHSDCRELLKVLMEKGVRVPCPESVEIGSELSPERISGKSVVIHAGCRIYGRDTLISEGVELGSEAPVTLHNCQLGKDVRLKGGFFKESTFLERAVMGSGAQVREACLLEEESSGAHTVGLKQTILFPFVTLGSLINFCDCLMAGGTDEKNHSEVGSSYIHFNYSPNQDKATPSLIGDVPRGVMLNQRPIFLGGQGGLVGPVRIAYGTVVAAGTIVRKDVVKENTMLLGHRSLPKAIPFEPGLYAQVRRVVNQNVQYIAQIMALRRWYLDVRSHFLSEDALGQSLFEAAVEKLDRAVSERLKRLGQVAERMPTSIEMIQAKMPGPSSEGLVGKKKAFADGWPEMKQSFYENMPLQGNPSDRDAFLQILDSAIGRGGKDYVAVIKGLKREEAVQGSVWLQGLVDEIKKRAMGHLPSF